MTTPTHRGTPTGVLLMLGSALSLQLGAVFAYQLFPHLGPWGVTVLRLACAAAVLAIFVRPRAHTWTPQQWKAVTLFGGSLALMNGTFYASIERIPVALAVTIEFLGPLILGTLLSRRALDFLWLTIAALGIGALGLEATQGVSDFDTRGVIFALLAGLGWALYVLTSARLGAVMQGSGGLPVAMGIAAIVLLPLGASGAAQGLTSPNLLVLALATGFLASVIPYTLELVALRILHRNIFSILLSMEPAIAGVLGFLLLGQVTGPLRWVSIVLLIAASIGVTLTAQRNPRPRPPKET